VKRYANGDPVTKGTMQEEPWYPDYQWLMSVAIGKEDVAEVYETFLADYNDVKGVPYPDTLQALRWAVLHAERTRQFNQESAE